MFRYTKLKNSFKGVSAVMNSRNFKIRNQMSLTSTMMRPFIVIPTDTVGNKRTTIPFLTNYGLEKISFTNGGKNKNIF